MKHQALLDAIQGVLGDKRFFTIVFCKTDDNDVTSSSVLSTIDNKMQAAEILSAVARKIVRTEVEKN